MTITARVRLTAKPGLRDELLELMTDAIAATRAHPLCSSVEVFTGIEGVDDVLLVEQWPSIEDHMEFIGGVAEAGGLTDILAILATDIDTVHYTPTGL
ncbi:MAG: putative quinol monooxygenase [Halioglobus sp.]